VINGREAAGLNTSNIPGELPVARFIRPPPGPERARAREFQGLRRDQLIILFG